MDPLYPENATAAYIRKMAEQVATLSKTVKELKAENADPSVLAERLPGKRVPYIASVNIDFANGEITSRDGRTTVTQDGHVIFTGLACSVRVTDAAVPAEFGRFRPPSSIQSAWDTAVYGPVPADFTWEVFDRNSDRAWQNEAIPSSYLFTAHGKPLYLPIGVWEDKNTTLSVRVNTLRVENACRVTFSFIGYKIVAPTPYTY